MLAIQCTPNIFLISAYVSLQQDIWYVKLGLLKNWKQLFLSVTYSVFIAAGVRYLFIFIPHLHNHEVPTKHAREKCLDPRKYLQEKFWTHEIPTRKNFGLTKYTREKFLDPRRHGGTMARDPGDPRWHRTHRI